jgi:acetyl-CoA carboxylase biotin carboxylase subunit
MNTRLQVEHPVTELVTGLDLVHLQLLVAEGHPLPITQKEIHLRGHAIECRIYAEDPDNNFFPSPGLITKLIQPGGPGLREDCAVYEGWRVPLDYDPMLSKLIAYAPTREMAIDRMLRALDEYVIGGIATNINFFRRILTDSDFRAANIDTGYLDRLLAKPRSDAKTDAATLDIATLAAALFEATAAPATSAQPASAPESEWKTTAREESLRS